MKGWALWLFSAVGARNTQPTGYKKGSKFESDHCAGEKGEGYGMDERQRLWYAGECEGGVPLCCPTLRSFVRNRVMEGKGRKQILWKLWKSWKYHLWGREADEKVCFSRPSFIALLYCRDCPIYVLQKVGLVSGSRQKFALDGENKARSHPSGTTERYIVSERIYWQIVTLEEHASLRMTHMQVIPHAYTHVLKELLPRLSEFSRDGGCICQEICGGNFLSGQ